MALRRETANTIYLGAFVLGRLHFMLVDAAGAGITGAAGTMTVRQRKNNTAAALIVPTSITEVDAVNMPGLYEIELTAAQLDTPGPMTLYIENAGADETVLTTTIMPRETVEV